jgi:hypothetical protein
MRLHWFVVAVLTFAKILISHETEPAVMSAFLAGPDRK